MKPSQSYHICPFCGGRVQQDSGYPISWYICQECGYQGSFIIEVDTLEDIETLKKYSRIKKKSFKKGNYNVFGEEYNLNASGEKYYIDQFGEKYKRCPLCLERLNIDDTKCRFCNYDPNDNKIKWVALSPIILVISLIVLVFADIYSGGEFHLIYNNISLYMTLLIFIILILYVIYSVIIAIKSVKQ